MNFEFVKKYIKEAGLPNFRIAQVQEAIFKKAISSWDEATSLPAQLREQLKKAHCEEREKLPFHQMLLKGELPYSIGGGIGQSRLCMLLLGKAHIGEVQASVWPQEDISLLEKYNIHLL